MDLESIIKNYSDAKQDKIVELAKQNKKSMAGNTYHTNALNYFFNLWHEHFPQQKQSKHCNGCRKAVCKFFHNVADYIISLRKAPEVVEVAKSVKTKKPKQENKSNVKKK
jgi:hypothetical protein|tara:strand:- start:15161 stop:15490 length:330 start_codon:yes stop_codon:yes gene_type:complete